MAAQPVRVGMVQMTCGPDTAANFTKAEAGTTAAARGQTLIKRFSKATWGHPPFTRFRHCCCEATVSGHKAAAEGVDLPAFKLARTNLGICILYKDFGNSGSNINTHA